MVTLSLVSLAVGLLAALTAQVRLIGDRHVSARRLAYVALAALLLALTFAASWIGDQREAAADARLSGVCRQALPAFDRWHAGEGTPDGAVVLFRCPHSELLTYPARTPVRQAAFRVCGGQPWALADRFSSGAYGKGLRGGAHGTFVAVRC